MAGAIGSGSIQAVNTLLFQRQSKDDDVKTTLYNVYKAKKNAEVSSGVGVETDLLVFSKDKCYEVCPSDLEKMKDVYDKELKFGVGCSILDELKTIKEFDENVQKK